MATASAAVEIQGSSPLARGLPLACRAHKADDRIIPARAGFTPPARGNTPPRTDHPRSRGVYGLLFLLGECRPGSSPLARGLRTTRFSVTSRSRIIPARAGFTESRRIVADHDWDHPRSRGVYLRKSIQPEIDAGSSPLARGLRGVIPAILGALRIIPARAGFTVCGSTPGAPCWDHPRSRGVYRYTMMAALSVVGSSPLARGLLVWFQAYVQPVRIIPARAGFTVDLQGGGSDAVDHPRSRGVYRTRHSGRSRAARIIPARAGFTTPRRSHRDATADHPRSRGVYRAQHRLRPGRSGSSPLARGLPVRGRGHGALRGIIPARAGFTITIKVPAGQVADHPRSRGVYDVAHAGFLSSEGSSPLARGLHPGAGLGHVGGGIIPARAGFTVHACA